MIREDLIKTIRKCGCNNVNYGWLGGQLIRQDNWHGVLTNEEKKILKKGNSYELHQGCHV